MVFQIVFMLNHLADAFIQSDIFIIINNKNEK